LIVSARPCSSAIRSRFRYPIDGDDAPRVEHPRALDGELAPTAPHPQNRHRLARLDSAFSAAM